MAIDLELLALEANREGSTDCVVTRRWLRQVLSELKAARAAVPSRGSVLDYKTLERR